MKRFTQTSMIAMLIALFSIAALAQPGGGGFRGPRGGDDDNFGPQRGARMAKFLDLTDEQKTKVEDMRLNHQREMLPLRSELQGLRTELKLAETAETYNAAKAESLVKKMGELHTKMHLQRLKNHQEMRSLLTTEQRKKFDSMMLSRGDGNGHGMRGGKGGHCRGMGQGRGCPNCN